MSRAVSTASTRRALALGTLLASATLTTTCHLDTAAPAATTTLTRIFRIVGVQAQQLRFDRLLDEAASTADPIHLMRVFGVSSGTAMRYLHAAHPERGAAPPR